MRTRGGHGDARRRSAQDVVRSERYTYAGGRPLHCSPRLHHHASEVTHPSIHPSVTMPKRTPGRRTCYGWTCSLAYPGPLARARAGWRSTRERLSAASLPCPATFGGNAWQTSPSRAAAIARSGLGFFSIAVACGARCRRAGQGHYCGWKAARRSPVLQFRQLGLTALPLLFRCQCPPSIPDQI